MIVSVCLVNNTIRNELSDEGARMSGQREIERKVAVVFQDATLRTLK